MGSDRGDEPRGSKTPLEHHWFRRRQGHHGKETLTASPVASKPETTTYLGIESKWKVSTTMSTSRHCGVQFSIIDTEQLEGLVVAGTASEAVVSDDPSDDQNMFREDGKDVRAPNMIEKAMEGIESFLHLKKSPEHHHHHHHKETHGTSEDIDESTPIGEVKAPNVFERAKEEVEAIVQAIHPKKESTSHGEPKKDGDGPFASIGRRFEKICSPGHKDDY
ncbi:hypothetical protein Sjap_011721 [Stephania japonica]|uniref:Uncharacterized protein n=1 Tax=Stephania japonica TaxID=461633 RepID=A0AAP0JBX8_9MAGN